MGIYSLLGEVDINRMIAQIYKLGINTVKQNAGYCAYITEERQPTSCSETCTNGARSTCLHRRRKAKIT